MKYKWKLMLSYIFSLFGTFIYLKGFFPVKTSSIGFSSIKDVPPPPSDSSILSQLNAEDFPGEKQWTNSDFLPKNFTKLVFIVIDGIREDFLFGGKHLHSTPFLRQQMLQGNAAGFVSRAHAPTVTMPRLKAITTGSIPGYVDVILNLDQTKELKEDNFIHSASADGRSIVFYGDDTWIKLFPGKFKRKDGTTSFFVNDYTIVDNNVTRHLSKELAHPDNFDIMILHYLGLDHIGHVSGPKSPLIDTKLKEMDFVVQQIYEAFEKHDSTKASNSLIVVTGDHGMTDKGSHGGTTVPERNVPLVFLNPGIRERTGVREVPEDVEQTDIATTLSVLLGLPIPQSSMGKIIGPVLKLLGKGDQLHAMQYNCHHLLSLAGQSGELDELRNGLGNPLQLYKDALINHATWLQHVNTAQSEFESAMKGYSGCQQGISDALISRIASYNNMELGAGMVLTWLGYLAVVLLWAQAVLTQPPQSNLSGNSPSSPLTWGVLATLGTVIHSLSLLSSSFLEEEHQTWYFITSTFLSVLFVSLMTEISGTRLGMSESFRKGFFSKSSTTPLPTTRDENVVLVKRGKRTESMDSSWDFVELDDDQTAPRSPLGDYKKIFLQNSDAKTAVVVIACLVSHRILRSWNQTGIQFADRPDVGDWLNEAGHRGTLTFVFLCGLVCLALLLECLTLGRDLARRFLTWLGLTLVFVYRVETGQVALWSSAESAQTADQEQSLGLIPARLLYFVIIVVLGRIIFLKSMAGPKTRDVKVMDYLLCCVVLLGSVLLRPHNVWALVFNLFLYWSVFCQLWPIVNESVQGYSSSNLGKIVLRTTLCYWFGQMSYFSMGNSNSLASIDVSAGYVGIATHYGSLEDAVVIFLLVFATYIGPIVWAMLCLADCVENTSKESKISKTESSQALLAVFSTLAFLRLTPMAFYMILVTAMRYHLFIWSVFAPKLLYEVASTIIYGIMLFAASITTKWITC